MHVKQSFCNFTKKILYNIFARKAETGEEENTVIKYFTAFGLVSGAVPRQICKRFSAI